MDSKEIKNICSHAVAEGMVLLENDGMLPLGKSDRVAVFGRSQFEYVKSGSGSGGLVVCPYVTNIADELKIKIRTTTAIIGRSRNRRKKQI